MFDFVFESTFFLIYSQTLWLSDTLSRGLYYLGPETVMPLASIFGAIIGLILIFWRFIVRFIKSAYKFIYMKITGKVIEEEEEKINDEGNDEDPNS